MNFTDEQLRLHENLSVAFDTWIDAERTLFSLGGRPQWKKISGNEYLYLITDRQGNGRSLGPRSPETEAEYERIQGLREPALATSQSTKARFPELAAQYRALRLPRIADAAARVLVECDRRSLLGETVLVVGTVAMVAYELEAMNRFATGLDATEDCDLTWAGREPVVLNTAKPLLDALKAVDGTYTVNTERPFQVRNAQAYEVEVLLPQTLADNYPKSEAIRPIPLPEQDWLLLGKQISQTVVSQRGIPARLVVPDPRYFALHKRWLADKPERNPRKVMKDRQQAIALWTVVKSRMPGYEIDDAFAAGLPDDLKAVLGTLESESL